MHIENGDFLCGVCLINMQLSQASQLDQPAGVASRIMAGAAAWLFVCDRWTHWVASLSFRHAIVLNICAFSRDLEILW